MSNIIKDNDDLLFLNDILNYIKDNEINKDFLQSEIVNLLPKFNNELLINIDVRERSTSTAIFSPQKKSIIFCVDKIEKWLDENVLSFKDLYKGTDYNLLRRYLFLYMVCHEIEHSYQFLFGEGVIVAPNSVILNAYKGLFDFLNPKEFIIPRPILEFRQRLSLLLYKINENNYLLERNANIESMNAIRNLACFNGNDDIYSLFDRMINLLYFCGYQDNNKGCIYNTYKKILMYDKYKKFNEEIILSEDERIRYGFSISDNTRDKLLKKIKK